MFLREREWKREVGGSGWDRKEYPRQLHVLFLVFKQYNRDLSTSVHRVAQGGGLYANVLSSSLHHYRKYP